MSSMLGNLETKVVVSGALFPMGTKGYSAYEIAVQQGFKGTVDEWLQTLTGPQGPQGPMGPSNIYVGDEEPTDKNINVWFDTNEEADIPTGGVVQESDPTVPDHVKAITPADINKWNTGGDIDLSSYATKQYVDDEISSISGEGISDAVNDWINEHPEAVTTVADGSITPKKTTFITPKAENLIDMSTVIKGYQGDKGVTPGGEMAGKVGCTTDYIELEVGKKYYGFPDFGTGGIWSSWFYDAEKNPIEVVTVNPFVMPENAKYVRLTYSNNNDLSTIQLGLYVGENPKLYSQGVKYYELDDMLVDAIKLIHDEKSVFKITEKNLYRFAGYGGINGSTGKFDIGATGSLAITDYIELTPDVFYVSNCFAAPNFSACYDSDYSFVSSFIDATERFQIGHDGATYMTFRITNPNVKYIVNGSAKTLNTPILTPFIVRGSMVPSSFEGLDVSTSNMEYVEAAKVLLGVTGNDLQGLTWAVLGDSITAASGKERNYHTIIAEKLGLTAINYGYNGSWISFTPEMPENNEMCVRYTTMVDDADIITCFGGINDINNNATLGVMGDTEKTTFYGALDVLIKGLLYKYPKKRIGFITPLNYGDDEKAMPYINAIFEVCKKYSVPVLDMYHNGLISTVTQELSTTYFADGLHPNEDGHDVMARKIEAFLKTL